MNKRGMTMCVSEPTIMRGMYKDRPAVIVCSGDLTAAFLPEDGGKLASLKVNATGRELLAVNPGEKYSPLAYDGDYVSSECSGFDDMFPTVDPCSPAEGAYKDLVYPDHGETCRISYEAAIGQQRLTLSGRSRLFPVDYQKTVEAAEDGGLDITYCVTNHGREPFPYLWAGHIMLAGEDGARVFTCFDDRNVAREMMFATPGIPHETLLPDRLTGFQPGKGAAYKFYYLEPMTEGIFGLSYGDGSRLTFRLDEEKLPWLGLWFNNGEFHDLYSITPEPCSVPFDAVDRAAARGLISVIEAGSSFEFTLHIRWD